MSNGNLIICDPEEGYAQALAYYLMHKKEFGMEVQVYDRIEKVQEIADRTKIQILFAAAEYEAEERKKVPAEQKFLLTGAGNSQVLEDETALYKYQSGEKIVKLLLENVDAQESENILLGQAAGKQAVRLIGVYSPVHRIGKTSYALKLALNGPIVTIRKFPKDAITMEQLIAWDSVSEEVTEFLAMLVVAGYNIFISGGTGSGKTTFLNALSNYIPKQERIITIEDNAELQIRGVENLVRLEARKGNTQGDHEITIRDLIRANLRMRPDRVIVGEVRGEETIDMIQANNYTKFLHVFCV